MLRRSAASGHFGKRFTGVSRLVVQRDRQEAERDPGLTEQAVAEAIIADGRVPMRVRHLEDAKHRPMPATASVGISERHRSLELDLVLSDFIFLKLFWHSGKMLISK